MPEKRQNLGALIPLRERKPEAIRTPHPPAKPREKLMFVPHPSVWKLSILFAVSTAVALQCVAAPPPARAPSPSIKAPTIDTATAVPRTIVIEEGDLQGKTVACSAGRTTAPPEAYLKPHHDAGSNMHKHWWSGRDHCGISFARITEPPARAPSPSSEAPTTDRATAVPQTIIIEEGDLQGKTVACSAGRTTAPPEAYLKPHHDAGSNMHKHWWSGRDHCGISFARVIEPPVRDPSPQE
jgi:hypothetical protein